MWTRFKVVLGRRQGPPMTQGSGRGMSTGQDKRLDCPYCHKYHLGIYRRVTGGCFGCGNTDHMIENCLQGFGISKNPQGSSRGGSRVPPPMSDRGRGRGSSRQQRRGIDSETVNCPTTTVLSQAYAMRAREDQDAAGVIEGNFFIPPPPTIGRCVGHLQKSPAVTSND